MKLKKISMLALAAMLTFASCSKEEVPGSGDMQSGETLISFNVGLFDIETYATDDREKEIITSGAKLFIATADKDLGAEIPLKEAKIDKVTGLFSAKVAAADLKVGAASLFLNINAPAITEGTTGTAMQKHSAATVVSTLNNGLTAGAPAGVKVDFTLVAGLNVITTEAKATRAITRVCVENTTSNLAADKQWSIKDFKISFDAIELAKGPLYVTKDSKPSTVVGTTKNLVYTVKETGLNTALGYTGEVVSYMYPSSEVIVTVEAPSKATKYVKFTPMANKNYTIKITPWAADSGLSFKVEVVGWEAGSDLDADFIPAGPLKLNPAYSADGITVKNATIDFAADLSAAPKQIDFAKLLGVKFAAGEALNVVVAADPATPSTRAGSADVLFSPVTDGTDGLYTVNYPIVYKEGGLKFNIDVTHFLANGDIAATVTLPVVINSCLPEGFMVDMGAGTLFTALNFQGSLADDIAAFNKVNASMATGKFSDKLISYLKVNSAQSVSIAGKVMPDHASALTACPKGFKLPALADYHALIANTLNYQRPDTFTTTNPDAYRVARINVMEDITDGNRKKVVSDYRVGLFLTGVTAPGGDQGAMLYHLFEYKGANTLILTCSTGHLAIKDWGGIFTSDASLSFQNLTNALDLYIVASATRKNIQMRCVRDASAAGVAW